MLDNFDRIKFKPTATDQDVTEHPELVGRDGYLELSNTMQLSAIHNPNGLYSSGSLLTPPEECTYEIHISPYSRGTPASFGSIAYEKGADNLVRKLFAAANIEYHPFDRCGIAVQVTAVELDRLIPLIEAEPRRDFENEARSLTTQYFQEKGRKNKVSEAH